MSSLTTPLKSNYLNTKAQKVVFNSDDEDDNFDYKKPSKHISKGVKREGMKKDPQYTWTSFIKKQENENAEHPLHYGHGGINLREALRLNLERVQHDQELNRLVNDTFPEQSAQIVTTEKKSCSITCEIRNSHIDGDGINYDNIERCNNLEQQKCSESMNPFINERSAILKLDLKTKTTKSRYENTINHQRKHQHQRASSFSNNCRESNSISQRTTLSDNDRSSSSVIRLNPEVAHKILRMQNKISEMLDQIHYSLCRIPVPDGEIDLKRRQQRMIEFAVRFSRNYLYDLGRQMTDIQRYVQVISPNNNNTPTRRFSLLHMQTLENKLITIHQLLLNALCAYCKHIPSSCMKGHQEKFQEVLQIVMDLKDVCSKMNLSAVCFEAGDSPLPPLVADIQQQCNAILLQFHLNAEKKPSVLTRATQSTLKPSITKRKKNLTENRKTLPNHFSTYNPYNNHRKCPKKRPVTTGCYMKEKTINVGRSKLVNPPATAASSVSDVLIKTRQKPNPIKRPTKIEAYEMDFGIKTMVEMIPADSEVGSPVLSRSRSFSASKKNHTIAKKRAKRMPRRKCSTATSKSSNEIVDNKIKKRKVPRSAYSTATPKSSKQSVNDIVDNKIKKRKVPRSSYSTATPKSSNQSVNEIVDNKIEKQKVSRIEYPTATTSSSKQSVNRIVDNTMQERRMLRSKCSTETNKSSKESVSDIDDNKNENGEASDTYEQFIQFRPVFTNIAKLIKNNQAKSPINPKELTMEAVMEILQENLVNKNSVGNDQLSNSSPMNRTRESRRQIEASETLINKPKVITSEQSNKDIKESTKNCNSNSNSTENNHQKRKLTKLIVPQDSIDELLDYRNKFQEHCQSNLMYASSNENKPWEVVSWAADKIIDELTATVANEFHIDNLIQTLFELEFQEC